MPSLEHHFLISMPSLENSWFEKTVIYLVEDNAEGTMGLVINLPNNLTIQELLQHFELSAPNQARYSQSPVLIGGPIDLERGFVLHEAPGSWQTSLTLPDQLQMTVSEDLLAAISADQIDADFLICLGFAGWEPGQLAAEMQTNSWLTIPYNRSLLFETPIEQRWEVALATLGIAPAFLSDEAGHA